MEAKRAICDRLERQLQLSANQLQRQHDVEERRSEAQRRLRCAQTTIQDLQAELQVATLPLVCLVTDKYKALPCNTQGQTHITMHNRQCAKYKTCCEAFTREQSDGR